MESVSDLVLMILFNYNMIKPSFYNLTTRLIHSN